MFSLLLYISESLRGCYPKNSSLPGLSGSLIPPKNNCVFLPKRRSPVKVKLFKIIAQQIAIWMKTKRDTISLG